MTDDVLIDYALNQLGPTDRAAVEAHLAHRPDDVVRVARLRAALRPLDADRDGFDPPHGLAVATIALTAEHVVVSKVVLAAPEPKAVPSSRRAPAGLDPVFPDWGWRPFDLAVAAGIGFLAVGLLFAGIGKLRHDQQVLACQNQLRELHASLDGYADTHGGHYPVVGTAAVPTAGAFVTELKRAGQYPGDTIACPAGTPEPVDDSGSPRVGYAYTLGYLGSNGGVLGIRKAGASDGMPISADLPTAKPHGRGQNVLYASGVVRYTTTTAAGLSGDEIYHNDAWLHRAGLHDRDASLGRPGDSP